MHEVRRQIDLQRLRAHGPHDRPMLERGMRHMERTLMTASPQALKRHAQEALILMRELADALRERIDWHRDVKAADLVRRAAEVADMPEADAKGYAGYLAGIVQTWVEMCLKDGKDWRPALPGVIERRLWLTPKPDGGAEARDAARWRRLVNASEMAFPVATIADDPENDCKMVYGRTGLERLIDSYDEISDSYAAMAQQEEQGRE